MSLRRFSLLVCALLGALPAYAYYYQYLSSNSVRNSGGVSPSIAFCVGNLGTGVLVANLSVASGQGIVVFHKTTVAPTAISDSAGNAWSEIAGVNAASGACVDADYTIANSSSTDTITVQPANGNSGSNNSIYACVVNNMTQVDSASGGYPYTQEATAHTGTIASPGASQEILLGSYYVEGPNPSFSGASSNSTGTGISSDLTATGLTSSTIQAIAGVTEPSSGVTVGIQRSITGGTTFDCGGIVGLVNRSPVVAGAPNDEFVGPFNSWINVKTAYGATGNGSTDDTTAIQNALNYLAVNSGTLYFPAGTYLVSSTLNYTTNAVGFRMIGHSHADTIIKWNGGSGGTLFNLPSLWHSEFSRLTFEGNNVAGIIIDYTAQFSYGGSGVLYFDDVFQNAQYALYVPPGGGDDNSYFRRCHFNNFSIAALYDNSFNAFSYHFISSTFQNNAVALNIQKGSAAVLNSVFINSSTADIIWTLNTTVDAIIGNVSSGSKQFFSISGTLPSNIAELRSNRILNPTQAVTIANNAASNIVLIDNQILSTNGTVGPVVTNTNGSSGNSMLLIGNQYTVSGTSGTNGSYALVSGAGARFVEIGDTTVASSSISQLCPQTGRADLTNCYSEPPNNNRVCYAGGSAQTCGTSAADETSAANIQSDINAACIASAAGGGTHPVVHLTGGTFNISTTISIPASCDVQLIGEGHYQRLLTRTVLSWTGANNGQMLEIHAHSRARVSDMYFSGGGGNATTNANGIKIDSEDVAGPNGVLPRVQIMDWQIYWDVQNPLVVNGLANTQVNVYDMSGGVGQLSGTTYPAVQVIGNGNSAALSRLALFISEFSDSFSTNRSPLFQVSNQGHLVGDGLYTETTFGMQAFNLTDSGTVSLAAFNYQAIWTGTSADVGPGADFIANGFNGSITLESDFFGAPSTSPHGTGYWQVQNPTNTNMLITSVQANTSPPDTNVIYGSTVAAIQNWANAYVGCCGFSPVTDNLNSMSNAQILNQFAQLRNTLPTANLSLPSGVSDVQLTNLEGNFISIGINVVPGV